MKRDLPFLLLFSCVAAGLLATPAAFGAPAPPALQWGDCDFGRAIGGSASVRCGWMQVPENRDDPASRMIRLRVTVIPSLRLRPEADPLVILSGGPGQAATDFYASTGPAFGGVRRDRDILVIDQRGTGESNRMDCQFNNDAELVTIEPQQLQRLAGQCLEKLPGDPRFYTTSVAVRDLDELRAALGYEKLSLYGVSYGTRVAQHYLQRYPTHVRAMILDGVVPVDLALGPDVAPRAQAALDSMFHRCAADGECDRAFPRIREQFQALRARLDRAPVVTKVPDPVTAQLLDASFGSMQLTAAVRLLTYSDETISLLPLLIHEAETARQPEPFVAQYLMVKRMTDTQFAYGMHFAVVCSEDAPRWAQESVSEQQLASTYLGTNFMAGMQAVCSIWPRGVVDEDFSSPLRSNVPVLILSGGNDPVTPAAYGDRSVKSFPNGRHLVLEGQGHGQLATGCMPRILATFIRSASAADLDTKCLDTVRPAPFMLSRTGTGP